MDDEFERFKIKEYSHWDLYLHKNQYPYVGRCYAWAKREKAIRLEDMNFEERNELFQDVVSEWEDAVRKLFNSTWTNLAIFGNEAPHLHAHLIPRYSYPVIFRDIEFIDKNPGGNYAPYEKRKLSEELLMGIKEGIQRNIFFQKKDL